MEIKMNEETVTKTKKHKSKTREYIEAIGTAILIALLIRAFVFEAFKIPSGSMLPTLSIGDHIFVNKFIYGFRIPFTKTVFWKMNDPERGDVVVFIYPVDESKDFIKRVVGLPGDRVYISGTEITINDVAVQKKLLNVSEYDGDKRRLLVKNGVEQTIPFERGWRDFKIYDEQLGDVTHLDQYEKHLDRPEFNIVVPPDHYFVMGDNRDNSADSRVWGFVPAENVKGKAMFVWLSIDKDHGGIRWHEFGRWIE
jgi:signal peptidase I